MENCTKLNSCKIKNIPVFVSHKGCPNNCIFCNQKKINGVKEPHEISECKKIIENALLYTKESDKIEIAFFGGSFTGIENERQIEYLKLANSYNTGIRLSTRPDYINEDILKLLKKYNVTTIELGVQSMSDHVLALNERGTNASDTINAVKMIRKYDFSLGIQMMTSMYGSDNSLDIYTANEIIKLKPDFVRVYPTVVIEGTKLYDLYKNNKYKTSTLSETVEVCTKIYRLFYNANIPVIRLGLMASDEINSENVMGAYHPAFGELVMSKFYYEEILNLIGDKKGDILIIEAPKNLISKISGHKKENTYKLKQTFKTVKYKYSDRLGVTIKCET